MQRGAVGLHPGTGLRVRHNFSIVIPAKAGIQWALVIAGRWIGCLDSRLRGNDEIGVPG
jgi:hypothetical protein